MLSGIDYFIEAIELEKTLAEADILITGEGRLDESTFQGKVISRLIELARKHGVKVYAICGETNLPIKDLNAMGIDRMASLVAFAPSKQAAITKPGDYLPSAVAQVVR